MSRAVAIAAVLVAAAGAPAAEPVVFGYLQDRGDLAKRAERIPWAKLTHVAIAFVNPTDDAGTMSVPRGLDAVVTAARGAGVKVLVSLGGGAASADAALRARYARLLDDDHRAAFVRGLADSIERHGLDGLDVDLEGPAIDDRYGAFIRELAKDLHARGRLLTAALSHTYGGDRVPADALGCLDLVNVMAYDHTGPWRPDEPGPHSSPEFARECVAAWLARGVSREKVVLGVPFYGHGFGRDFSPHGIAYRTILARFPEAAREDRVGDEVWLNAAPTIRAKAEYVRAERLGGIMIWSLDHDAEGDASLLSVVHASLRPEAR